MINDGFNIFIDGERFRDDHGRHLILRGVNLAAKTPSVITRSHRDVSFIGRPFPLEEADEHFSRLRSWGLNLLRLCVTWEGIEHSGPGIYDEAYLEYLVAIKQKASKFGFKIFIDFHQDVWSRFTGGDGAPGWTLEKTGFEIDNLSETGATVLYDSKNQRPHILWATNAYKLGAATMFTLFFGGSRFAPKKKVGDENIEHFLQNAYVKMVKIVVERLKGGSSIIGYDIMNEPFAGYIGCKDLTKHFGLLQLGDTPTPFQGMVLGDGNKSTISVWEQKFFAIRDVGEKELNLNKKRAWQENISCVWREEGIWDYKENGEAEIKKPDYFKNHSFEDAFYKPFINKVGKEIHQISPKAILLIEHIAGGIPPEWNEDDIKNVVFTGHWYDAFLLVTKRFFGCLGFDMFQMKRIIALPRWMRKAFASQIKHLKTFAKERMGNIPLVITEFGIPFDLEGKKGYKTGNFSLHDKALHRSFLAIDDNLASAIVWNYTSHNSNHLGDHWNEEDLSVFSRDQENDSPYSGVRAKHALIRPYSIKTAGLPRFMHFHMKKRSFEYHFEHDPAITSHPTEIFLPHLHFGKGFTIELSDGRYELHDQILHYYHTTDRPIHVIKIKAN